MFNWNRHLALNNNHDNIHFNTPEGVVPIFYNNLDTSCLVCYPFPQPAQLTNRFTTFWNWFRINSSAHTFSRITLETFNQFITDHSRRARLNTLDRLLKSIRYQREETRGNLIPLIENCATYTRYFTINLE